MGEASADVMAQERRRHPRLQPNRRITIRYTEGVMSVFGWGKAYDAPALLDLSPGGARLAIQEAPEVGSVMRLDFKTDEGESFEALGEIRWSRSGASGADGFQCGVEFFKSTVRQRQEINDLCRRVHHGSGGIPATSRRIISA